VKLLYRAGYLFYKLIVGLTGGVRVYGREHLPATGSFLICANHCSLLDPPLVGVSIGREIGYVAKEELFKYPILRSILHRVNAIPVNRARLSRETIKAILNKLKTGRPVVLFPEGTRSRDGRLGRGKTGIGLLARLAGTPVVPALIENTRRWPRTYRRQHRLAVRFGPPLPPEWMTKVSRNRDGYRKIVDEIMARIRILHPDAGSAPCAAGRSNAIKT
jgi:1-acyl-sn-glycerol-3-phosphate acyltransferase